MAVAGYNIYLGGVKQNTSLVTDLSYALSGLTASTAYNVTVSAVDDAGNESAQSSALSFTTSASSGGSFDSDYQAVLDYATANSIPVPNQTQQELDNQRMKDYKTSGVYAKSDVLLNLEGANVDEAFRRICWKRKIQVNSISNVTEVTMTASDGIRSLGDPYWDLLYNPATDAVNYSLNNASVLYYLTMNTASGVYWTFGGNDGTSQTTVMGTRPSGDNVYSLNDSSALHPEPLQILGMNGLHRNNSANVNFTTDNGTTTITSASTALPNIRMLLWARDNNGTVQSGGMRTRFFAIGANMEAEQAAVKAIFEPA